MYLGPNDKKLSTKPRNYSLALIFLHHLCFLKNNVVIWALLSLPDLSFSVATLVVRKSEMTLQHTSSSRYYYRIYIVKYREAIRKKALFILKFFHVFHRHHAQDC